MARLKEDDAFCREVLAADEEARWRLIAAAGFERTLEESAAERERLSDQELVEVTGGSTRGGVDTVYCILGDPCALGGPCGSLDITPPCAPVSACRSHRGRGHGFPLAGRAGARLDPPAPGVGESRDQQGKEWWRGAELNCRHRDFQSSSPTK